MRYVKRIVEEELRRKLQASGAVLVRGPKYCGKTQMALRFANSTLHVDQDPQIEDIMTVEPARLLRGDTPRLLDEWQEQPKLWTYVRHEIDRRGSKGQFILTGSSTPTEATTMHSGAGRFTIVDMRTMSWQELTLSTGAVSLAHLIAPGVSATIPSSDSLGLEEIIDRIIRGGWPGIIDVATSAVIETNRAYIDLLADVDMSRSTGVKRESDKVRKLLRSLARNTGTLVDVATLERDIEEKEPGDISRPTITSYLEGLHQLMVIEDQPAWDTHIRSSASLRKAPKRHFTDVSLAVAALGADTTTLLDDIRFAGFLFESLATHDLRVYAQACDAKVYYYRDSSGLEIDAIVQKRNGDWAAFEIKLGPGKIDEAASNLLKLADIIDYDRVHRPSSLNIITGTGVGYTRADGVNVIPLSELGV